MERDEVLKNLMVMAVADGELAPEEMAFLRSRAREWDVLDGEFQGMLRYAEDPDAELTLPETKQERIDLLGDLIRVMATDGRLAVEEKRLFALAAAYMDLSDSELNALVDLILAEHDADA